MCAKLILIRFFHLILTCTNECRTSNRANHDESTVAKDDESGVRALFMLEESSLLAKIVYREDQTIVFLYNPTLPLVIANTT